MKSLESVSFRQASFLPEEKPKEKREKRKKVLYFHQGDYLEVIGHGIGHLSSENLKVIRVGKKGRRFYKNISPFTIYYDSASTDLLPGWTLRSSAAPRLRPQQPSLKN